MLAASLHRLRLNGRNHFRHRCLRLCRQRPQGRARKRRVVSDFRPRSTATKVQSAIGGGVSDFIGIEHLLFSANKVGDKAIKSETAGRGYAKARQRPKKAYGQLPPR